MKLFVCILRMYQFVLTTNKLHTVGLPISETYTKNQFVNEPEGLQQFQDHHWKALGGENSDLSGPFLCDHF